jgi:hypothetical protein
VNIDFVFYTGSAVVELASKSYLEHNPDVLRKATSDNRLTFVICQVLFHCPRRRYGTSGRLALLLVFAKLLFLRILPYYQSCYHRSQIIGKGWAWVSMGRESDTMRDQWSREFGTFAIKSATNHGIGTTVPSCGRSRYRHVAGPLWKCGTESSRQCLYAPPVAVVVVSSRWTSAMVAHAANG